MASNINPYNIDGTFPVAGQDNDSQGFRDNFTNISNNFSTAATEISDLQGKAILKSALTGGSLNNNMGGSGLSNLLLSSAGFVLNNQGTLTGAVTLDFSTGNIQKVTTGGPITLGFSNWPVTGSYGKILLWLVVSNTTNTLTVSISSPGVTSGLGQIAGADAGTGVITFDEAGTYLFEFSTLDAGNNVHINEIGRNATSLHGTNLYYNPDLSSTLLLGYGNGLESAKALEQGQDVISAAGSYNSVSIGNLALANIANPTTNIGGLAGYSVTSTRGNLAASSYTPVQSNDLLGYVNSITYTGNATANVFQQISSIGFYATGSNVVYGLGGNIAFFTHKDGGNGTVSSLNQAMGIENDQSTRLYGNLILKSGGAPATSSSTGVAGQVAYDGTYFYVCTSTNTWKRVALNLTSW